MRRTVVLLGLAVAAAGPSQAQSNRGAFGLDARVAPTTGFGFAYYVTDGLSLRPWLGLGYSDYSGFYANLGAQLRFEPAPARTLSPYLSATAQYSHYGNASTPIVTTGSAAYRSLAPASDLGQLGAGAGLRYRLSGNLALFGEGRVMYATSPVGSYGTGWSTIDLNDRTRAEVVLGVSYLFR
jgi:outer membrane scaffolding protein for murein synthesis (MipA/OmpV family)